MPTFGVTIELEEEWVRQEEGGQNKVARFAVNGDKDIGLLTLELAHEPKMNLKAFAKRLGKRTKLAVKESSNEVIYLASKQTGAPPYASVQEANGHFLVSVLYGEPAHANLGGLKAIHTNIKAVPFQHPVQSLETTSTRPLYPNGLQITLPRSMRPLKVKNHETERYFGIQNYQREKPDTTLHLYRMAKRPGLNAEGYVADLARRALSTVDGVDLATLVQTDGDDAAWTSAVQYGKNQLLAYGAFLHGNHCILVTIECHSGDPETDQQYFDAMLKAAKSIATRE